ncbi:opacity protein [Neisseria gonorrhoeae MS11]|nr:opacity protein [Neisseria gonorrhoeae MS11]
MNPARKKPSLLFSSLLFSSLLFSSLLFSSLPFSSLPQRRRRVKAMAAARMCRRI